MKLRYPSILLIFFGMLATGLVVAQNKKATGEKKELPKKEFYSGEPVKALIITGGCCHNYLSQSSHSPTESGCKA